MIININDFIVSNSEICGGTPTFKGTRIMVWQVLELLEAGTPVEEILTAYPVPLTRGHVKAALHYAAKIMRSSDNVVIGIEREETEVSAR